MSGLWSSIVLEHRPRYSRGGVGLTLQLTVVATNVFCSGSSEILFSSRFPNQEPHLQGRTIHDYSLFNRGRLEGTPTGDKEKYPSSPRTTTRLYMHRITHARQYAIGTVSGPQHMSGDPTHRNGAHIKQYGFRNIPFKIFP